MLAVVVCTSLFLAPPQIRRDSYGVPHITAATDDDAYFEAGYAVAQDRLWQMENSRRIARGEMAEVFGPKYAASDRETLKMGYTDDEMNRQCESIPEEHLRQLKSYVKGINSWIDEAKSSGNLPPEYAQFGFQPEPWTTTDTVAISIRLLHLFGTGGAGQLRNLAALMYLQLQPKIKDKALDVLDDLEWQNDPEAVPTVLPQDDPLAKRHIKFPDFDRGVTQRQLAALPKVSLLELFPAIGLASNDLSKAVAERANVAYRTGSYCVAVNAKRSVSGIATLMNGPQMGFTTPSVVHEMSIQTPGLNVSGLDVPGMPGVLVGSTPFFSWGITSGAASTDDIFYFKMDGPDSYDYGSHKLPIMAITRTLKIKGQPDETVVQKRTLMGPILLTTASGYVFARREGTWMRETNAIDCVMTVPTATNVEEIEFAFERSPVNFNMFYATVGGDIGWRFLGEIPIRAPGLDPRLPALGDPKNEWRGVFPQAQLPHVRNPESGLIYNWNNKPASWWPNLDTPVWGKVFRTSAILDSLPKGNISAHDVEMAAWTIARTDSTFSTFAAAFRAAADSAGTDSKYAGAATVAKAFDGNLLDGSASAAIYDAWFSALREKLFLGSVGNLTSPTLFRTAIQPTVMLRALQGRTKFPYLNGRKAPDVAADAFRAACDRLAGNSGPEAANWRYVAGSIHFGDGDAPALYSDRGTYIQILEMAKNPTGRNVLPPGEAESGAHSHDQSELARTWQFKPMFLKFH